MTHWTYIGQTENLRQHLCKHQSGHGAQGTRGIRGIQLAGFISGISSESERLYLETKWRRYRNNLHDDYPFNILAAGERLICNKNDFNTRHGIAHKVGFC